jgi:hypothetical protein
VLRKQEYLQKYFKAGRKVKKNEMAHTEMTEDVQYDLQKVEVKRWGKKSNDKEEQAFFPKGGLDSCRYHENYRCFDL